MGYIYLVLSVVLAAAVNSLGSIYNQKNDGKRDAASLFSLLVAITVLVFWAGKYAIEIFGAISVPLSSLSVHDFVKAVCAASDAGVILYSVGFGICYTAAMIGLIYALKFGPLSLTSLMIGLSLILTAIWGLIFWNDTLSACVVIGLVLVAISLYFCIYNKKADAGAHISVKWLVFAVISVIGNAGCSIIQRTQQQSYQSQYGNQLMFFAMLFCCAICLVLYLKDRKSCDAPAPKQWKMLPIAAGLCNFFLNVCVIGLVTTDISTSLIYPTIAVGSIILNLIVSVFVIKEKITVRQWIGIVIGTVAVLLLSL